MGRTSLSTARKRQGVDMDIMSLLSGNVVKSIENIASEWIETDKESAEAKTIMIKALDPNGKMRRDLARNVAQLYTIYLMTALTLLVLEFFGVGALREGVSAVSVATDKLTELFLPITGLFGTIVTASFGVNYANVKAGQ